MTKGRGVPSRMRVGLGLTLTQHLLLRLLLAWRGPRLGPAPACLTLNHLSVCLSVRWFGGPTLSEVQPLPFSPGTRLGWGTLGTKPRKWEEGAGEMAVRLSHVGAGSHSKGGLRTVPLWRACGRGRRHKGATPREAGSWARGTPCLSYLDGDHTLTLTTPLSRRLLSADFPVPPSRWYDPPAPSLRAGFPPALYCV